MAVFLTHLKSVEFRLTIAQEHLAKSQLLVAILHLHWLIQFTAKYHIAYVGAVNELLKQLNALHSYDLLNQYAAKSLAIVPENSRGYYWLIHSLKVQGMDELASNEYQLAKQHLTTEEYKELCTSLGDSCE